MSERRGNVGPYEIVEELQPAGAVERFLARGPSSPEPVVVERLAAPGSGSTEAAERFAAASAALAELRHPRLAAVVDRGEDDEGRPYRVREHFDGPTLADVLARRRLALHEAIGVCKKICEGLDAAHRRGVVHGRLAPAEVHVSEDFASVFLTGFGLRGFDVEVREGSTLFLTGSRLASLEYRAPEALPGSEPEPRSDVYSAGVIFYEMLTGRVPTGRVRLPSQSSDEVPSLVDPVAIKSLADEPAGRHPSAAAFLAELERLEERLRLGLVSELHGLSRSTSSLLRRSAGSPSRRRWIHAALIAAGILIVLLGVAVLLAERRGDGAAEPAGPPAESPSPASSSAGAPPAPSDSAAAVAAGAPAAARAARAAGAARARRHGPPPPGTQGG